VLSQFSFKRLFLVISIFGLLSSLVGYLLIQTSNPYGTLTLIFGYLIFILGGFSWAIQKLISEFQGDFSYKNLCLTAMFMALTFYLLTPLSFYLFQHSQFWYLALIPVFFSFISACFSIYTGILFFRKK